MQYDGNHGMARPSNISCDWSISPSVLSVAKQNALVMTQ